MQELNSRGEPTTAARSGERLPYRKPQVHSAAGQLQAVLGSAPPCPTVCTPSNTGEPACLGTSASDPECV